MDCLYINLDSASQRRAHIEADFAAAAPANWRLLRVAATTADEAKNTAGSRRDAEKACWLSHRRAIAERLADDEPVMIVEDDTCFSPRAFGLIDALLQASGEWDLLFTDVIVAELSDQARLMRDWSRLSIENRFRLLDLARTAFAGANAYVVRGGAKRHLLEALDRQPALDLPYDIQLARLIHSGVLRANAIFPFVTTLSAFADRSSIQAGQAARDVTINAFRRLMYVDRDLAALRSQIDRLPPCEDEAAELFGQLTARVVSPGYAGDD
jgi:GR25 family glycosyltransferase involved in LPS biosynthesis